MAQVLLLKVNSTTGFPQEMDSAADDITLNSFTITGGGPVLSGTGLDLNGQNLSDAGDLAFTDPTTDGITRTDGTHAADDIMMEDAENSLDPASGAILFGTATDSADQLDAFRLPAVAGTPTATPADGGEGYLVWDSSNDKLYAWDGSAWDDLSTVQAAEKIVNSYTLDAASGASVGDVVYISAADTVSLADVSSTGAASRVIGMAATAATDTNPVDVASDGVVTGLSGLTAGSRYFADPSTAGGITTSVPTGSGNVIFQVGIAKSTTAMHLNLQRVGSRA